MVAVGIPFHTAHSRVPRRAIKRYIHLCSRRCTGEAFRRVYLSAGEIAGVIKNHRCVVATHETFAIVIFMALPLDYAAIVASVAIGYLRVSDEWGLGGGWLYAILETDAENCRPEDCARNS